MQNHLHEAYLCKGLLKDRIEGRIEGRIEDRIAGCSGNPEDVRLSMDDLTTPRQRK